MTLTELKAEISTSLQMYEDSGLVDHHAIDLWIKNALKKFGNNVMQLSEKVLRVEKSRTPLPEDFWRLYVAAMCKPTAHKILNGDKDILASSVYWTKRIETEYGWNNLSESHNKKNYKEVVEREYYRGTEIESRYQPSPVVLSITRGFNRDLYTKDCVNIRSHFTRDQEHEINLTNNYIETNFKEGHIYIQYYGLPKNEDGEIVVSSPNSHLEEYLEYLAIRKTLQNIMLSSDADVSNKIQYFLQMERESHSNAMTESKFNSLGENYDKRMRDRNRATTMKYEQMFPNL